MNNMYIIPANTKNGKLIFNIFRTIDLVIFAVGVTLTLLFMLIIPLDNIVFTIIKLLPIGICGTLVVPIPYYHNVMCFLKDAFIFINSRRVYYWKGWCVRSEYGEK